MSGLDVDRQQYRRIKSMAKQEVGKGEEGHYRDVHDKLNTPEGATNIYKLAKDSHRSTDDIGHVVTIKDEN